MIAVYMLRCGDGSYYVGSTRSIDLRLAQHASGHGGDYTSKRLPVELVYLQEFEDIGEAYAWEKRVQGWSRKKREALIESRWDDLPGMSRSSYRR